MTEYLFIGGPIDGQWRDVPDELHWRIAIPGALPAYWHDVDPLGAEMSGLSVATYTRRRYRHPAWRFPLTFYVAPEAHVPDGGDLPVGYVLPGGVIGVRMPFEPLPGTDHDHVWVIVDWFVTQTSGIVCRECGVDRWPR